MVPHLFGGIGLIAFGEIRLAGGDTGMIDYVVDLSSVVKYNCIDRSLLLDRNGIRFMRHKICF